ncbi:methyl-accepting chemotaxis protein [Saccharibacillus kuerlensis]|uniref:Methyl-accepting chemotaxis protein n=1 Tax=Saccharibacillus kuerlensis TaxID=459527 RepID=A0ABQ2L5Z6_9BACL|nr:methyl-accepting chemotaxis protein [Saccharibacillus kuerlensis]GGO01874.1 methyl-accepting chemotaxis protein [Saccharibacillus kuerlensis]
MNKFNSMKVNTKFIILASLIMIVAFSILIAWNLHSLKRQSEIAGTLKTEQAGNIYVKENTKLLQTVVTSFGNLASDSASDLVAGDVERDRILRSLTNMMNNNPSLSVAFTAWEPDAYDEDAAYAVDPIYGAAGGRFALLSVRYEDGKMETIPFIGFEQDAAYSQAKATRQTVVTDPYDVSQDPEVPFLISTIAIPVLNDQGEFLGVVGASFVLNELQKGAEAYQPLGGYVTLLTGSGTYIANPKQPELVGQPAAFAKEYPEIFADVQQGKFIQEVNGEVRVFVPLQITEDSSWYAQTIIPKATIMKSYTDSRNMSIIVSIASLILLGAAIWFLTSLIITRPINRMVTAIKALANGDFTQTVPVTSKDEFGLMAADLNEASATLRGMLKQTAEIGQTVKLTSEDLKESAEQTSLAAQLISESIEHVATSMNGQSDEAVKAANMMEEMTTGVRQIAASSSAMSKSAENVIKQTEQGDQLVQSTAGQMNAVYGSMQQSGDAMKRLGERSREIEGFIGLIASISSQTNILALNASIEAARAGEQGKGFAVVATEIRNLAEQTRKATEQVQAGIEEIALETRHAVQLMDTTASEVEKGVGSVAQSGALFETIMQEMREVGAQAHNVSTAVEQMAVGAEQVADTVALVSDVARKSTEETVHVAAASEEQQATMQEISASATHLSSQIQDLMDRVVKFKL